MKNFFRFTPQAGLFAFLLFLFSNVSAQTQPTISYQGVLQNNGAAVNGMDTLKISIYEYATGGTPLYTETQSVDVSNGIFNVSIGSVTPLLPTLDFTKQYYLGVSVNGDAELTPRSLVSFAPYAFRALYGDTATYAIKADVANGVSGGVVNSVNGETGSVTLSGTNGITVSNNPPNIVIGSTVVQSLNTAGGKLTLVGAGGTTITDTGSVLTIRSATFTGGTGIQNLQNTDGTMTITNGNGPTATIGLAQQSATTGQTLEWNGSAWRPATIPSSSNSVDSIKNLQDARDDGSSVYLGAGSGVNNSGLDSNVALGIMALDSNTTGYANTALGYKALASSATGYQDVAIGSRALSKLNSGANEQWHVAVGAGALQNLTSGSGNTAVGFSAMNVMQSGEANTVCGSQAMIYSTSGTGNSVFGAETLEGGTGSYNSVFGFEAMLDDCYCNSGSHNCAFGDGTLSVNQTGNGNTAIGSSAMAENTSGSNNVALGVSALRVNRLRSNLVAIGYLALTNDAPVSPSLDSGTANTAVGSQSLTSNTMGSYNTATGDSALLANTLGYRNTALGYFALNLNSTGNDNTAIGSSAGPSSSNLNNTTSIGSGAQASASNSVVLGSANVTSLYCVGAYAATTANSANMYVNATGQIMRSTSSARYKTNIHDLDINTDRLYDLRPVSYTSKIDGKAYFGLVAEDVAKVLPDLAEYARSKDVIPGSTSDEMIPDAVKYPMLSVLLLDELKKEHAKVESEEKRADSQDKVIADLERRLEALEAAQNRGR